MIKLHIDKLSKYLPTEEELENEKYIVSYKVYINYFRKEKISTNDLLAGLGFVYSWMPRILSVDINYLKTSVAFINTYKKGKRIEWVVLFKEVVKLTKGSIVGASKLLHFIFPKDFPIYDSHIYRFCWGNKRVYHSNIKKEENYFAYKEALDKFLFENKKHDLIIEVKKLMSYKITNLRALEFAIFNASKKKYGSKR